MSSSLSGPAAPLPAVLFASEDGLLGRATAADAGPSTAAPAQLDAYAARFWCGTQPALYRACPQLRALLRAHTTALLRSWVCVKPC